MAHACGGHGRRVTPATTVADVVAAHPELLETLKSLGINHCCGAHLTLAEAAASAGIPLDDLLKAIGEQPATSTP